MSKKAYLLIIAIALIIIVGAVGYAVATRDDASTDKAVGSPPATSQKPDTSTPTTPTSGTPVTLAGKAICLEYREPQDVQITLCATGFQTDDGRIFAMTADDPSLSGGIPTGEPYQVTGVITDSPDTVSQYKQQGTLHVTAATKL